MSEKALVATRIADHIETCKLIILERKRMIKDIANRPLFTDGSVADIKQHCKVIQIMKKEIGELTGC